MTDASLTAPHTKRTSGPGFWKVYAGGRTPNAELQTNMLPIFLFFYCTLLLPHQSQIAVSRGKVPVGRLAALFKQPDAMHSLVLQVLGSRQFSGFVLFCLASLQLLDFFTHKVRVVKSWHLPAGPAPSKAESCSFFAAFLSCFECKLLSFDFPTFLRCRDGRVYVLVWKAPWLKQLGCFVTDSIWRVCKMAILPQCLTTESRAR